MPIPWTCELEGHSHQPCGKNIGQRHQVYCEYSQIFQTYYIMHCYCLKMLSWKNDKCRKISQGRACLCDTYRRLAPFYKVVDSVAHTIHFDVLDFMNSSTENKKRYLIHRHQFQGGFSQQSTLYFVANVQILLLL